MIMTPLLLVAFAASASAAAPAEPVFQCTDKALADGAAWHDARGDMYTCDAYAEANNACTKKGHRFANEGMTANVACCACGGGTRVYDDFSIYWDGHTPQSHLRRHIEGPAMEQLMQYRRASAQGIRKLNDTHVFVPFGAHLTADAVRENNVLGEVDVSVVKLFWTENPVTVFGKDVHIGAAEKWHVVSYSGKWNGTHPARPERPEAVEAAAKAMVQQRNGLETSMPFVAQTGRHLLQSGSDVHHYTKIFQHAYMSPVMPSDEPSLKRLRFRLQRAELAGARSRDAVLKNDINCHHLERTPGLEVEEDLSGMVVPLNRRVVSLTGLGSHAPWERMSFTNGVSAWFYDEAADVLERYYMASSFAHSPLEDHPHLKEGEAATPAGFFVGPADGKDMPHAPLFGRSPSPPSPGVAAVQVDMMLKQLPVDYTFLRADPEVQCPQPLFDQLNVALTNLDTDAYLRGDLSPEESMVLIQQQAIPLYTQLYNCMGNWLEGAPSFDRSHSVSGVTAVMVVHGLLEVPTYRRVPVLGARTWNDIEDAEDACAPEKPRCDATPSCPAGYTELADDAKCLEDPDSCRVEEACCHKITCLRSNDWWPHWDTQSCVANHAPSWQTTLSSQEECCRAHFNWKFEDCMGIEKQGWWPNWGAGVCEENGAPFWQETVASKELCCGTWFSHNANCMVQVSNGEPQA
eukprot:TRINITY_DN96_c0_g3_i1.p1 TRINITY_DN96_c0_g3~~TRINITY_DN96_c0_g3_i1.p1  ORF type:complete len:689 (+),score=288.07 TRINITY_DN96_c0_g3_i1:69-2135(+)